MHFTSSVPPRAALFDMDGLLVDTEPVHAAAYVFAFQRAGLRLDPEAYRQHVTLGGGSIRDLYQACGGAPQGWNQVWAEKCRHFRELVRTQVTLLPGVEALLNVLTRRGTPCLLVTGSSRRNAEVVLNHFGLERFFSVVLTGDDVARAKPDPEVFFKAEAVLGLPLEECVSFEDSPKGVQAASQAGVPCVAVPTDWTRKGDFTGAALVVESLVEVTPALLETLWRARRKR